MKNDRLKYQILRILADNHNRPVSSADITLELESRGMEISERTVRFHLLATDQEGLTQYIGKKGRVITEKGQQELSESNVVEKIGFLSSRIDKLTYSMNFNLESLSGKLVVNLSSIHRKDAERSVPLMMRVFEKGYSMGRLTGLFSPAHNPYPFRLPDDHIGIATVCSISLNGILLKYGIPVRSKYGGLLELMDGKPTRFVALISYDGTTLDPLEIFIKSKMTDYLGATKDGNGLIGASFREIPADARGKVLEISEALKKAGLHGFMEVGYSGQPVREIPVNEGMIGCVVIGGLNPVAILEESGIPVNSKAMCTLSDFSLLRDYTGLPEMLKNINDGT